MAKRFTDNEKWKKQFFKGLSTVNKLFFLYILDDCDHAGLWHVEPEIAEIRIGEKIDIDLAKKELGKHIVEVDNGEKWFIPSFVEFQYGNLNPSVNAHKSVINQLGKRGLMDFYEQFKNSSATVNEQLNNCSRTVLYKYKDQDKDKDKDKDKETEIHSIQKFIAENLPNVSKLDKQLTSDQCNELLKNYPEEKIKDKLMSMENFDKTKKKKYTSVYLTCREWLKRDSDLTKTNYEKNNGYGSIGSNESVFEGAAELEGTD